MPVSRFRPSRTLTLVSGFIDGRRDMVWTLRDGYDPLEITINDFVLERSSSSSDDPSVDVTDFALCVSWGMNRSFPTRGMRRNFRASLKNCIEWDYETSALILKT